MSEEALVVFDFERFDCRNDVAEVYRVGDTFAVRAPTWAISDKVNYTDFADDFKKNPLAAARDFGSDPPSAKEPLIRDKTLVSRKANTERTHPMTEDGRFLDWFEPIHPRTRYYFHGDLAKNRDSAGFALCHYDPVTSIVVVDLMMSMIPKEGLDLRFRDFRALIYQINDLGFNIAKVTFDSWQSLDTIQTLEQDGYEVEIYSVDRGTQAYDTLLELIFCDRLDYYPNALFAKEMQGLNLINGNKVDHGADGSKDLSDAVAGATTQCVMNEIDKSSRDYPGQTKAAPGSPKSGIKTTVTPAADSAPSHVAIGGITARHKRRHQQSRVPVISGTKI